MKENGNYLKESKEPSNHALLFRHGISPITKNVRNIRYTKKLKFDFEKVKVVESVLKDMIEYGFSEHVDEELLHFDDDGNLSKIEDGKSLAPGT